MSISRNQTIAVIAVMIMVVAAAGAYLVLSKDDNTGNYPEDGVTVSTFADGRYIDQIYEKAPERIIAGNDTVLEMLLYFGLGDHIVAVFYDEDEIWSEVRGEYDKLIDRLDSRCVTTGNFNQAFCTELEPDLIMGYASSFGSSSSNSLGTADYWNRMGCNIWSLNSQNKDMTMDGMRKDFDDLGDVFNIRDRTDAFMSGIDKKVESLKGEIAGGVTIAILDRSSPTSTTYWFYGDSSFIGGLIKDAGATNKFPEGGTMDKSKLIDATDVDIMIVISYLASGTYTPQMIIDSLANDTTLQHVPAIKNGNMIPFGLNQTYGGVQVGAVLDTVIDMVKGL